MMSMDDVVEYERHVEKIMVKRLMLRWRSGSNSNIGGGGIIEKPIFEKRERHVMMMIGGGLGVVVMGKVEAGVVNLMITTR